MSNDKHWDNDEPITARTKIALKILLFMFKVLSPYRFATTFEKEIAAIQKDIEAL